MNLRKVIVVFICLLISYQFAMICNADYISDNGGTEYWGVLISNVFPEWSNDSLAYRDILCKNGWQQDHIKYFNYENATYANVVDALLWLANNSDSNDKVLFYDNSHGGPLGYELKDKAMTYYELNQFFDNITYDGLAVFLGGCHSGGAISYLEKEKRVILTSVDNGYTSTPMFSDYCLTALEGFADIEGDNNSLVSAEEIYNFAKNGTDIAFNNKTGVDPQISDNYNGELYLTRFNYLNWPGVLDQYAVHTGNEDAPIWDNQWYAQSFVPKYPILSALMLNIRVLGNPGPLIISIKEELYGDDICSVTIDQNSFYRAAMRFWIINLPNITVTPGHKYWMLLKSYKSYDTANIYYFTRAMEGYTKGGSAGSLDQGTTWGMTNGHEVPYDFYFATLGRPINNLPYAPDISGPTNGEVGVSYEYIIYTTDPDGDNVSYYIDWGDNTTSEWLGPYLSNENITVSHTWNSQGTYNIRVKAKDTHKNESDWATYQNYLQSNSPTNIDTPGFQLIFVVCAIALVLFWKRKKMTL